MSEDPPPNDDPWHGAYPQRPMVKTDALHFVEMGDGTRRKVRITRAALEKIALNASTAKLVLAFEHEVDALAMFAAGDQSADPAVLDADQVPNAPINPEEYWDKVTD